MEQEINPHLYARMLANWRSEVQAQTGRDAAQRAAEDEAATPEYRQAARVALAEWRAQQG